MRLLQRKGEPDSALAGRVIYRTKEDVRDWNGKPLFPLRQINPPIVVDLGVEYQRWLGKILNFFEPATHGSPEGQRRAAGWRAGQALQWATSSVQAGIGYLLRQAVRARLSTRKLSALNPALAAVRPYRNGAHDEPLDELWARIVAEVDRQLSADDLEDIEYSAEVDDDGRWRPDPVTLNELLSDGVALLTRLGQRKWDALWEQILKPAGDEKVVLFAQPIETVTAVAAFLERKTGQRPALIIGNQTQAARDAEVASFCDPKAGRQFLVSSRAGGEGINLQVARRLVHLDVPWNPMDLEQRIGRVHRFKSTRTILVDTLVAKDSREVDTYQFAREKLRLIASSLVPDEKFEALFSRVMALVPPEELQDVMIQSAIGPLSDAEQTHIAELVSRGFRQWQNFHDEYAEQRKQIIALEPGAANWSDLSTFAQTHAGATPLDGYYAFGFDGVGDAVEQTSRQADVLAIGGKAYSCGDYGGMPVQRSDGSPADRLGTNIPAIARVLRRLAFPELTTGAAHLRWPDDLERPAKNGFGLIFAARQTVRSESGTFSERALTLHGMLVETTGQRRLERNELGPILRYLQSKNIIIRKEADDNSALRSVIQATEEEFISSLRRPSDQERLDGISHGVFPLFAAVIA